MGLRERFRQIGEGFAERRRIRVAKNTAKEHRRSKIEERKKELAEKRKNQGKVRQLMIDADKSVDLKGQLLSVRDFLNGRKPEGNGSWKLIEISGMVGTQGAHGFALIRKNAQSKEDLFRKGERYSYVFVGRYFKGKQIAIEDGGKKHVVWDVGEESVENLTIRAGETARYYGVDSTVPTNRIIPTKRQLKKTIIDDSTLYIDHYVASLADAHDATKPHSFTTKLQIAVGRATEIKHNLKSSSWGRNKRGAIQGEIMRYIGGVEAYNQRLGEGGRGIRKWHLYRS